MIIANLLAKRLVFLFVRESILCLRLIHIMSTLLYKLYIIGTHQAPSKIYIYS